MVRIILYLLLAISVSHAQVDSISQYGITFYFDTIVTKGQFADSSWWVLGPVTIDSVSPGFDSIHERIVKLTDSSNIVVPIDSIPPDFVRALDTFWRYNNGSEIDPITDTSSRYFFNQGFQSRGYGGAYDRSLSVNFPFSYSGDSIITLVKTTHAEPWTDNARPCIKLAVPLTIVPEAPPNNGVGVFRPPYVAGTKPYYFVDSIHSELLPMYEPVASSPPDDTTIINWFKYLRLDHKLGSIGRAIKPKMAMNDYQPDNIPRLIQTPLRFMLNDEYESKLPALIFYLQSGIDGVHEFLQGCTWPSGGSGHQPCHLIIVSFTATLLNITEAKNSLITANAFHGSYILTRPNQDSSWLWGEIQSEFNYWNYLVTGDGSKSPRDPYGNIDGGLCPGSYQLITGQAHVGEILCSNLMPVLKEAWPSKERKIVESYVERWMSFGTLSSPDTCAPATSSMDDYGVLFGPDGRGGCIVDTDTSDGIGRFPDKLRSKVGEQFVSTFVNDMWEAYYKKNTDYYDSRFFYCKRYFHRNGTAAIIYPKVDNISLYLINKNKTVIDSSINKNIGDRVVFTYSGSADTLRVIGVKNAD
ncbi:MAG: hypothetical protein GX660_12415 [Clostridiaceae bacterium]|nr:hypothetical protein [Clostridiaceae bacterium]